MSTERTLARLPNLFPIAAWHALIFFWRVKQRKKSFLFAFISLIIGEASNRHSMMREDFTCFLS